MGIILYGRVKFIVKSGILYGVFGWLHALLVVYLCRYMSQLRNIYEFKLLDSEHTAFFYELRNPRAKMVCIKY